MMEDRHTRDLLDECLQLLKGNNYARVGIKETTFERDPVAQNILKEMEAALATIHVGHREALEQKKMILAKESHIDLKRDDYISALEQHILYLEQKIEMDQNTSQQLSSEMAAQFMNTNGDVKRLTETINNLKKKRSELEIEMGTARRVNDEMESTIELLIKEVQKEKLLRESSQVELEDCKRMHNDIKRMLESKLDISDKKVLKLDTKFKELWKEMKVENQDTRDEVVKATELLNAEKLLRGNETRRAKECLKKSKLLELRVMELEQEINRLVSQVQSAKAQNRLMKTIAKIRNETTREENSHLGFDGLVHKIDKVTKEVERQCKNQLKI